MLLSYDEDWLRKIVDAVHGPADTMEHDDLEPLWEWDAPDRFALDPVSRLTTPPGEEVQPIRPLQLERPERPGFNQRVSQQLAADVAKAEKTDPRLGHQLKEELKGEPMRDVQRLDTKGWMTKHRNGKIPLDAMVKIERGTHYMRKDAARAYKAMQQAAKKAGIDFLVTDSYRDFAAQVRLKDEKGLYSKGGLAAVPGTSNHGWGVAVDINVDNAKTLEWLQKNGRKFGFHTIDREPWHWEYRGGFKGGGGGGQGRQRRPRRGGDGAMADPLGRVSSVDSIIFAPTVFGNIVQEVTNPPQTKQEWRRREADIKAKGLSFVPKGLRRHFLEAAQKYNVPARLLAAMANTESGFDKNAVSSAGAQGVMQIMQLHGLKDPFNARKNIDKGAAIFASYINAAKEHHLSRQHGPLRLALAMYNAGPNASDDVLQARMRIYSDPILRLVQEGK